LCEREKEREGENVFREKEAEGREREGFTKEKILLLLLIAPIN